MTASPSNQQIWGCPPLTLPGDRIVCAPGRGDDIDWIIGVMKNMYVDAFINVAQFLAPSRPGAATVIALRRRAVAARAAIFALASLRRALVALLTYPETHDAAATACDKFRRAFPNLLSLRNTIAREFERPLLRTGRAAGRSADFGALHDRVSGNLYATTSHAGSVEEIEFSPMTMEALQEILQALFDELRWTGRPHLHPH